MLIEVCRDEACRRLRTDQRNPHPGHGGSTLPVEIEIVYRDDAIGRRAAMGGRPMFTVKLLSGVWPSDTTLLDACAESGHVTLGGGTHGGGTVSAHADADREVEVAIYG